MTAFVIRMAARREAFRALAAGGVLAVTCFFPLVASAQKGLTPAERREMREEGYSPAEINDYNREVIRDQQPYSAAEKAELRRDGYSAGEINRMQKESVAEARADREFEILQSQYDRGAISDAQFERKAEQIEKQSYTQAYGAILGAVMYKQEQDDNSNSWFDGSSSQSTIDPSQFYSGLQQEISRSGAQGQEQLTRLAEMKSSTATGALGIDQARYSRDYVLNGDKPLEAERGLRPKGNALLPEKPQWLEEVGIQRLSKRISLEIARDLMAIKLSLPEDASLASAQKVIEGLKEEGKEPALVSNLVGALGDGDLKRLKRNAELLGVGKQEIARMSLSLAIDDLAERLEKDAGTEEIRRRCLEVEQLARTANLAGDIAKSVVAWFGALPDLLQLREQLEEVALKKPTGEPALPSGTTEVILDPNWEEGRYRVLPNGWLVCGAKGTTNRIVREKVDARLALGLPIVKKGPEVKPVKTAASTNTGFIYVSGAPGLTAPARYRLLKYEYRDVPVAPVAPPVFQGSGGYEGGDYDSDYDDDYETQDDEQALLNISYQQAPAVVRQWVLVSQSWPEYSVAAGKRQQIEIKEDRSERYEIELLSNVPGVPAEKYSLLKERGKNVRYELRAEKDGKLTIAGARDTCTLSNQGNSNPFHYMIGGEHKILRPDGEETFESSVTIRYCEQMDEQKESNLILEAGETGYVGLSTDNLWTVSLAPTRVELEHNFVVFTAPVSTEASKVQTELARESVAELRGSLYVVSVGVSQYADEKRFPRLNAARSDAEKFVEKMKAQKGLYEDVHVTTLLDQEATAVKIRMELAKLTSKVTKDDVVVIFLSGHGKMESGKWFFCPFNAEFKGERLNTNKAIASRELKDSYISPLKCRHACLLLDSCHSGGATQGFKELGKSGVVVFASSTADELSEEAGNQGAFTKSLLNTLADASADKNSDTFLEIAELDRAITKGVRDLTSNRQHFESSYPNSSSAFKLVRLEGAGG